ncbi:pyruvate carboxylase [Hyphobacterium sp. CCMP332]|nr:pyruvate carboxylase [Hyphobacterium sp. CCMP332]
MKKPFEIKKLLVANRGEIAIRVLRAASEMRITTVAIYTFEDRYSLHRYKADEAYQVGEDDQPLKPYLDIEEIINVAKKYNVDAIHPGYGFLSENVAFAKACRDNGIIFVGPDPEIMDQLGDKVNAKKLAKKIGVPLIESSKKDLDSLETAIKEAKRIGYPVMLKAASGGGGRGMRVCKSEDDLNAGFSSAQREAKNAFGDDTVFLEKFIDQPKHIEVQLLGDKYGNLVHLYERDCSVQRRFQKVVEVAPSSGLKYETREKLFDYALNLGQAVGYNNAGTVEFLVDKKENIYFIEVNPRIQVEHTVTEEVTGIDIVRSQILIAAGQKLSSRGIFIRNQADISCNGFAIQCRITTEDPKDNFKPDYGTIIAYRNAGGFGIRIDEGSSYPGVKISPFFDSMLAKVTASGRTFKGTCARLSRTLREFRIRGVKTNIPFLENVIENEIFQSGKATVNFIADHSDLFELNDRLDRGTRVLKFIADTTVNGNPDVKYKDPVISFHNPKIPSCDRFAKHEKGTKQQLDKLGADKFVEWLKKEKKIHYTDTTFRDAHQSLLATRVRTKDMMAVAESFSKNHPNLFSMEVWGGATFDVSMRFLKEDPWIRLQRFREAIPNILLQMLLRGSNAVGYKAYPDNLVIKFIEKAAENGIDVFRIFDSLNWLENMKVSINTVRNNTNALVEACICYTGDVGDKSKKKYDLKYYLDLAKSLEDAGAHILAIKDMAGLLKPHAAELLIGEIKNVVDIPIHLHTHDTSGAQMTTYHKAIDAGVDIVDVAISSMSGLTSQPSFNSMVETTKGNKRHHDFNIDNLNEFSHYWEEIRKIYHPFESDLKSSTADVYEHEIPGGQYSNLGPQARSLGLDHRMEEIKKKYAEVNQLFGDIVKVTPSSKVVGDMALYLVSNNLSIEDVMNKGADLSFPDSVKSFFKGELGQPYQGFPEKIQKIVLKDEKPFTERPNAKLEPIDFDKEFKTFQKEFDKSLNELHFISYKLYPKVFKDFYDAQQKYGDVSAVPSPIYFFGMEPNEEAIITIADGKTIIVKLIYITEPNEDGMRVVGFKLNGQSRAIDVKDTSIKVDKVFHEKVSGPKDIGAPIQGLLSKIFVKAGDKVKQNQPLFVIEAMKMETNITAPKAGIIDQCVLNEGRMVESDDLIIRMK